MSDLAPPHVEAQDPGAHELSDSSDADHFSSASEGGSRSQRHSASSIPQSSIPQTRVERVDDRPAHGEVPGTSAYDKRAQDAVPDEIEVVPEGSPSRPRSRATSSLSQTSGSPVPRTVVERVDDKPAHGEVEGTYANELRKADATPDEVRQVPSEKHNGQPYGSKPQSSAVAEDQQSFFHDMWAGKNEAPRDMETDDQDEIADDFDDFAEEAGDDDFGDFDEAEVAEEEPSETYAPPAPPAPDILQHLPPLNVIGLSPDATEAAYQPYLDAIFRNAQDDQDNNSQDMSKPTAFLSERSLSLWQQLVSPPPMQPPNWTRSRIRRLFLVSLGVPVDLDEILPPSKQKRLVLPNINLSPTSPRQSTALERLKESAANASTGSVDSKGNPKRPKAGRTTSSVNKGLAPPPELDTNAASILCSTTPEAMSVYADTELREHIQTLENLNRKASLVLEYWLQRKDEGIKEKESLEKVIENLVGWVKGRRAK